MGIPVVPHKAKQVSLFDYGNFDYIIGMDTENMRNLNRIFKNDKENKLYKFLSFADSDRDIADPWYTEILMKRIQIFWKAVKGF